MTNFAGDLDRQMRALAPAIDGSGDIVEPRIINAMIVQPSGGGAPAGDQAHMNLVISQTGALGVVQPHTYDISFLTADVALRRPEGNLSTLGLRTDFVTLFGPLEHPRAGGHGVASALQQHRLVIYYLAAREAYKEQRYPESLYYVGVAEGMRGRSNPPQLAGVIADLDTLKKALISRTRVP